MPLNKGYLTAKTDKASDEVYTPEYAVKPLLKYLDQFKTKIGKDNITIWCPFDLSFSKYVSLFTKAGYKVISSHIDENKNFFFYEPEEEYDIIISNPPFSCKDDVLKRLYELDKPYAILMPLNVLQGQKRFKYLKDIEILVFDKRINYLKDINGKKEIQKGVSFASIYLCRKFLPKDLIMKELNIY